MTPEAIDAHVHVRTGDRARADSYEFRQAAKLFGADEGPTDVASYYRERNMRAIVFDVDSHTRTGQYPSNDAVADLVDASGGTLIGFATIDPWAQQAAIDELDRCVQRGMRGLKVQPITQDFDLDDPRFRPLWSYCQDARLPVLVHTGTTGIGASSAGGGGLKLSRGRPVPHVDNVAASFPDLTIIAAHFGWPWYLEALAVARHKQNVFLDLSGWAPKYVPHEVIQHMNSVIPHKFIFGSDFPLLTPDRWLSEFDAFDLKDGVRDKVLHDNVAGILELE